MKEVIIKYGTFLIVPFVIAGIVLTLATLKVREKTPVTLVCLSADTGIVYVPQGSEVQVARGKRLVLEFSQRAPIECQVAAVEEEPANKRVRVRFSTDKGMDGNSICNAYVVTGEIMMFDLVLRKGLKM